MISDYALALRIKRHNFLLYVVTWYQVWTNAGLYILSVEFESCLLLLLTQGGNNWNCRWRRHLHLPEVCTSKIGHTKIKGKCKIVCNFYMCFSVHFFNNNSMYPTNAHSLLRKIFTGLPTCFDPEGSSSGQLIQWTSVCCYIPYI